MSDLAAKYQDEYQWWKWSIEHQILPWYRGELRDLEYYAPIPPREPGGPVTLEAAIMALRDAVSEFYPERQLGLDRTRDYGLVLDIGSGPLCPTTVLHGLTFAVDPGFSAYRQMGYPVDRWGAVLIEHAAEDLWMLPSGIFDTILSHNALNHVDDFERTIAEMERLARPTAFWRIQAEYHEPTLAEPILLTDERIQAAFRRFRPVKINETPGANSRFVLWGTGAPDG